MLTDDEAVAGLLGLTGTRRAALDPDATVAAESAAAKVQRVLPRAGRWYATGLDSRSRAVRSFRLDRVTRATGEDGQFQVPAGFDPATVVTEAVSGASYPNAVSVRVQGGERAVRMRMPGPFAVIDAAEPGWVRWRVERLDWVPSVLAGLGLPFVIEEPDELRDRVRALAGQLASWGEAR